MNIEHINAPETGCTPEEQAAWHAGIEAGREIERNNIAALTAQPAVDDVVVERIAALLHEETTGEPWTVAGVEHPGPDRDYYRGLAHKVAALATHQQGGEQ